MRTKSLAVWLVVCVLSSALPLMAQAQKTIPGASRNKGITVERPASKPAPQRRLQAVAPPKQPVCEGANYQTDDFNDSWLMGGPIVAIAWTPSASVTVSRIEVFTGEASGNIALGIWSDDGGLPSKPLADLGDTGYFPLPTTTVSWQGSNLLTPVTVTAGTKYWVLFDPIGGEQAPIQNGVGQQYWGSSSGTISSVPPADWFGPFSFSDHAWKFRMFCLPAKDVYAVKFLCGSFLPKVTSPPDGAEYPVKPGNYLTAINVHNPNPTFVGFMKKAVLLYRADGHFEFEQPMPPGKLNDASLKEDWGMEIDCPDIRARLLGGAVPAPTFIKGWVIIEVAGAAYNIDPRPLDVTAVYTAHGWNQRANPPTYEGFSEDVESVLPKRVKP
jgi:hypothetical protein